MPTVDENNTKNVTPIVQSQVYSQIVDLILSKGNSLNYPVINRSLVLADINAITLSNGNIKLEINIEIGLDPEGCPTCPTNVVPIRKIACKVKDNWYWGAMLGKCNGPLNSYPANANQYRAANDAAYQIQAIINETATKQRSCKTSLYSVLPNYNIDLNSPTNPANPSDWFFINIANSGDIGPYSYLNPNYNPNTQPDNYAYRMYVTQNLNNICLNPDDIEYYRSNYEWIILNHKSNNRPWWNFERYFASCQVFSDYGASTFNHIYKYSTGNVIKR